MNLLKLKEDRQNTMGNTKTWIRRPGNKLETWLTIKRGKI